MLTKLHVRNFKSLRDVTVDLERFTIFVGPNGSGKSSILQAVDQLCRIFKWKEPYQQTAENIRRSVSNGQVEGPNLSLLRDDRWFHFVYTPAMTSPFRLTSGSSREADMCERWSGQAQAPTLNFCRLLRLEHSKLIQPGETNDLIGISPTGEGLHSLLRSMRLNRSEEVWNELLQDLRSLIPSIRRIRFMANMPHALLFDTESGDNLQAAEISEGTILVLGMLAILHADPRPSVLLIDDMDRGLHPRAQQEWVQLLRRLLEKHADLQILATTHSPYLLDNMCFEEVRMTLLHEGQTLCASLTAHEKYEKWKDEMAPGEMWSLFGEQWLASKKEEHVAP